MESIIDVVSSPAGTFSAAVKLVILFQNTSILTLAAIEETGGMETGILLAQRYRIKVRLGEGGMGVVSKAHDTLLDRTVAHHRTPGPLRPLRTRTRPGR